MLPLVAAVLPAEKGHETLANKACCRVADFPDFYLSIVRFLSINRAFPASFSADRQKKDAQKPICAHLDRADNYLLKLAGGAGTIGTLERHRNQTRHRC
jgi:hypothetical protein